MDVRFSPLAGAAAQALAARTASDAAPAQAAGATGFSGVLDDALRSVSRLQEETVALQRQFQLGDGKVSLEQTMMAMQNSQLAFQAALTVRNRLVAAYTDIMNMPV
ncbi:MAG TPA: flagellar hook-basal body complex protein FliE [Burkholderiaceae bacterium]|nr:flagellar hook-basal body complex protein FliE [Burkholderiaceae bacterium]